LVFVSKLVVNLQSTSPISSLLSSLLHLIIQPAYSSLLYFLLQRGAKQMNIALHALATNSHLNASVLSAVLPCLPLPYLCFGSLSPLLVYPRSHVPPFSSTLAVCLLNLVGLCW
jgi:hypothetical protein